MDGEQAGSLRPACVGGNSSATALVVAGEAAPGRWSDGHDGVQPADRQDTAASPSGPVQDEPTVDGAQVVTNTVEHGQPGGAEELQPGQIEHDFPVAIPAQLIEYLLEMGTAGQIELSTQSHPTAQRVRADVHPEHRFAQAVNRTAPSIITRHRDPRAGVSLPRGV